MTLKRRPEPKEEEGHHEHVTATQDEDGTNFLPRTSLTIVPTEQEQKPVKEESENEYGNVDDEDEADEAVKKTTQDFKSRLRHYAYSSPVRNTRSTTSNTISSPKPSNTTSESPSQPPHKRQRTTEPSPSPSKSTTTSSPRPPRNRNRSANDPYYPANNLTDAIRPDLHLLMIGLNPGLMTASTGHAYAHPSNLFWKLLYSSGLTSYRHPPSDTHNLMDMYGIGNTNLCERPTRDGSGLTKQEMEDGVAVLEEKVFRYRPEVVCIVGKGIWDTIHRVKLRTLSSPSSFTSSSPQKKKTAKEKVPFHYGWQSPDLWLGRSTDPTTGEIEWEGARTFVATTTSGLAAGMRPAEKEAVWKELGKCIVGDRARRQVEGGKGGLGAEGIGKVEGEE